MDEKILDFIKEKQLIQQNTKVLAAVSGGPDSLALLYFLWVYKNELAIDLAVISIDHCLRGQESKEDGWHVQRLCELWNIPCIVKEVNVAAYKKENKVGTQLAARTLRYEEFEREMMRGGYDYLAFGHHGDDQIETVLMALIRRANPHNLIGIPVKRQFAGGEIIRPLLCVGRREIEQYLHRHDIEARIDASNFTKDYTRNRLRADVVPQLKEENINLITTIQKLTETLAEDEGYLMEKADYIFQQAVKTDGKDGKMEIDIRKVTEYPVSLQRRVFRLTLDYLYVTKPKQLSYRHEELFLRLLHNEGNRHIHFPQQLIAERSYQHIYCYFQRENYSEDFFYTVEDLPEKIVFSDGSAIFFQIVKKAEAENNSNDLNTYLCSKELVEFPLYIRSRKSGDRMTYDGFTGAKKVKNIFIDEKIPRHQRNLTPILTDAAGEVLWIAGLKKNTKIVPDQPYYVCIQYKSRTAGIVE